MIYLLYFYLGFTHLFAFGIQIENEKMRFWQVLFAPIIFPVYIGMVIAKHYMH